MKTIKEFKVNNYITLKLEGKETIIYIQGKRFRQCKKLIIVLPIEESVSINEIKSIDDITDKKLKKTNNKEIGIPSQTEFWAHCSNLQVWSENNYDSRLLHSSIAFPLLKKLYEKGDPIAKKMFKEEIIRRYKDGSESVREFLYNEDYLSFIDQDELIIGILRPKEANLMMQIILLSQTRYKMVRYLDEDEVRERLFLNTLYFSVEDGYIKQIELDLNQFSYSIPKFLSECKKLMTLTLHIHCNHKAKIDFCKLESISNLEININGPALIPNKFQNFPNLYSLNIYGNNGTKFEELPDTIGLIKNLGYLNINSIQLKRIPDSITKLKNLEYLILRFTNLEELSESICNLASLVRLSIDGNPILDSNHSLKESEIDQNIHKIIIRNKKKKFPFLFEE